MLIRSSSKLATLPSKAWGNGGKVSLGNEFQFVVPYERWREARSSLRALQPGPRTAIMRYWQKAFLPGDATYLLGLIRDHKVRERCF
jgi:hypothetical protein